MNWRGDKHIDFQRSTRAIDKRRNSRGNNLFLNIVLIYLALGSLPRLVPLPGFRDNIILTELLVYLGGLYITLTRPRLGTFILRSYILIFLGIFASFVYGCILIGWHTPPFLYNIRLILMIVSATAAGYVLYERYSFDLEAVLKLLVRLYIVVLVFAFTIYFAFPDSVQLWLILSQFGIEFNGDPHQRRLVSAYFDPNYFGAIAVLPMVIGGILFSKTRLFRYLIFAFLVTGSILLTVSRSALATFFLTLSLITILPFLRAISKLQIRRSTLIAAISCIAAVAAASPLYINIVIRAWKRFISTSNDASALGRWLTFKRSLAITEEHPLLGIGYNFFPEYASKFTSMSSVDSSVQSSVIAFGLVGFCIGAVLLLLWSFLLWRRASSVAHDENYGYYKTFTGYYLIYIAIVILFTSQFNNVLYYQFWLNPVLAIGVYLTITTKNLLATRTLRNTSI